MTSKSYAPVLIVAYNRLKHLKIVLKSLSVNAEAIYTDVYMFVDGPKSEVEDDVQNEILAMCSEFSASFKSFHVHRRELNLGLARNITKSIDFVLSKYEAVIVLEDDIEVSCKFLKFMNESLYYYRAKKSVWHIAAHTLKNDARKPDLVFLWGVMNCWGWATWRDRWEKFEKNPEYLLLNFSNDEIYKFDLDGTGVFWRQVVDNHHGKIDTWAIFWYATIFRNNGLCVNPWLSYARNIGFDGSGHHTRFNLLRQFCSQPLNEVGELTPNDEIYEDKFARSFQRSGYLTWRRNISRRIKLLCDFVK